MSVQFMTIASGYLLHPCFPDCTSTRERSLQSS